MKGINIAGDLFMSLGFQSLAGLFPQVAQYARHSIGNNSPLTYRRNGDNLKKTRRYETEKTSKNNHHGVDGIPVSVLCEN
jgi:hypothetical protein